MTKSIEELRAEISLVDTQLIELMAKRQTIAVQIGNYKKAHNLPVFDQERESLLRRFHDQICKNNDLAPEMVAKIFEILIDESRKVQQ